MGLRRRSSRKNGRLCELYMCGNSSINLTHFAQKFKQRLQVLGQYENHKES